MSVSFKNEFYNLTVQSYFPCIYDNFDIILLLNGIGLSNQTSVTNSRSIQETEVDFKKASAQGIKDIVCSF